MSLYRYDGGSGRGFFPRDQTGIVWNRGGATAVAVGDVMMFDINSTDAATTSALPGNDGFILANVIDPIVEVVTDTYWEIKYCVVIDLLQGAGADNTLIKVATSGVYDIDVDVDVTSLLGVVAVATTDRKGTWVEAAGGTLGHQIIAKPLVEDGGAGLTSCWVNCEGGWGYVV